MTEHRPEFMKTVLREMPDVHFHWQSDRRLRVDLPCQILPTLLELLKGRGGYLHLSAISCVDWEEAGEFELIYHLWSYETRVLISAHIRIPRDPGRFVSVYDIHTPAGFFERDIHEMFGVLFEGAPDLRPFILTDWSGPPPMRKSFSSLAYVEETFAWREYDNEWLREIREKGGDFVE
jgi:NADH-quinone oxidoreductase subunit C